MNGDRERVLGAWFQVAAKADQFFSRVATAHAERMRCAVGCADCCADGLSVMLVEALALAEGLSRLSAQPSPGTRTGPTARCALLHHGRCLVYSFRPLICRTHGLPVGHGDDDVDCCPLNFREGIPPDAVLDAGRLTAMLAVADAIARQTLGLTEPVRIPIRHLFERGAAALPESARHFLA